MRITIRLKQWSMPKRKSELTEEEYNRLNLQEALEYTTISTYVCETKGCEKEGAAHESNSADPPHNMLYANSRTEDGSLRIRFMSIKSVCPICMIEKTCTDEKYFKTDTEKYRVSMPKAKGDRGKNYYKDFTKNDKNTASDPEIGKNFATKVSKKDEANFMKNMEGKI